MCGGCGMCGPCKKCCSPLERVLGVDRLDLKLDDDNWKPIFSRPGGCFARCTCCSPAVFLAYRVFLAALWLGCCIWSLADTNHPEKWLIFLTHWGAVGELIYLLFAAGTTFQAIYGSVPDGRGEATPWFVSVTWGFGSMIPTIAIMVFALYWILVFEPGVTNVEALTVVMHGGNVVVLAADMLANRQPYYVAHTYLPLLTGLVYVLFTLIYHWAGGTGESGEPYIYSAVDWSNPSGTGRLMALIVFVGVPVLYILVFVVVLQRRCCRGKSDADAEVGDAEVRDAEI